MLRLPSWVLRIGVAAIPWVTLGCALDVSGTGDLLTGADEDGGPGIIVATPDASDAFAPFMQPPMVDAAMTKFEAATASDTAPPSDTSVDDGASATEAGACAIGDPSCIVVPPGWSIVAFSTTRARPCPHGFDQATTDVVEGPNLDNACACSTCSVVDDPTCNTGDIQIFNGSDPSFPLECLTQAASDLSLDPNGGCSPYPGPTGPGGPSDRVEYVPPAASGGACSAPGAPQPDSVTYATEGRVCTATSAQSAACSGGNPCMPEVTAPYAVCIMMAGPPAPCPPNSLFSTQHLLGTAVDFSCSDCDCEVTGDCTGTLNLFDDGSCQFLAETAPVDGTCHVQTPLGGGASYEFVADPANNVTCTADGTSTPAEVALESAATVCCSQ